MTRLPSRKRAPLLDWRITLVGGLSCLAAIAAGGVAAYAAIERFGWVAGAAIAWVAAPLAGAAGAVLVFLWLLPLGTTYLPATAKPWGQRRSRRSGQGVASRRTISVVMPCYNAEHFLPKSLSPLVQMMRAGEIDEIIVVDDGSTDRSPALAAEGGATVMFSGGRLGPGGARNVGSRAARGDILWFVDSDVVVHREGPTRIREAFMEESVVAVFGSYDDAPPQENFGSQYKNLLHHYHHQHAPAEGSTFWAGCGAVLRTAFDEAQGFDAKAYNVPCIEDVELGYRLHAAGGLIRIDRHLLGTHLKRWSIYQLVRTDIVNRAIPWARLILETAAPLSELNVSGPERLRAALAAATVLVTAAALLTHLPLWVPLFFLLTALTTNWPLFKVFQRSRGTGFAILAIGFHQFYYLYSMGAFLVCFIQHALKGSRESDQKAPVATSKVS